MDTLSNYLQLLLSLMVVQYKDIQQYSYESYVWKKTTHRILELHLRQLLEVNFVYAQISSSKTDPGVSDKILQL